MNIYCLLYCSGTYDIVVGEKVVHTYTDDGSFGELALLYNTPRAATVKATSDGVLWALVSINVYPCEMFQQFLFSYNDSIIYYYVV